MVTIKLCRAHHFTKHKIIRRQVSDEAKREFSRLVCNYDWDTISTGIPTNTAINLEGIMDEFTDYCFPVKVITIKSTDQPWMNNRIRRLIRRRKRILKREARSPRWRAMKKLVANRIRERRKEYMKNIEREVKEAGNSRAYFQAIKRLQKNDASERWTPRVLFPGETDQRIAEKGAEFFNSISQEFDPIPEPARPGTAREEIPVHAIAARLRKIRKPKTQVKGDICSELVTPLADVLAIPLAIIYGEVYRTNQWPDSWKNETVYLIPKKTSPMKLAELRNISCTPLFSKVLETFLLDKLKEETSLSNNQYGGTKGCGPNHFLIDAWNDILTNLEDPRAAVNLLSVDFEKAFNRLDHHACLRSLLAAGATPSTVELISAFLYNRTMQVKIGQCLSTKRFVPRGSPQGSILGNYLFCATTDRLGEDLHRRNATTASFEENGTEASTSGNSTPATTPPPIARPSDMPEYTTSTPTARGQFGTFRPPPGLTHHPDSESSDDEVRPNLRFARPFALDSSSEDDSLVEQAMRDAYLPAAERWTDTPITVRKYIDDFNGIEKVRNFNAAVHIASGVPSVKIRAQQSQELFDVMENQSSEKGMRINPLKTQILCITGNTLQQTTTTIRASGHPIQSGSELKILGFYFGTRPSVERHIENLITNFRSKIWSLFHLKTGGMEIVDLITVYRCVLLPILDYTSATYHSMLTLTQDLRLERLQKRSLKIIFNNDCQYQELLNRSNLTTLHERREKIVLNFARKAAHSEIFKYWFPLSEETGHDLRRPLKYKEFHARTDRLYNSPLFAMRRLLNKEN